jgi:hypothetical protein
MAIQLDRRELSAVLERAMRDARDPHSASDDRWIDRISWLSDAVAGGDAKGKTYIAATGGALLAKATNSAVDTLTQSGRAGGRGYSLRSVVEFMQRQLRGQVHLGTLSKNPMNNAPFLRGPPRVDRFTVASYLQHVYREYLVWMQELDGYDRSTAHRALVAYLRVRMRVQIEEDAAATTGVRMDAAHSAIDLLEGLQLWMSEDPEDGGRGQAVVAGVLRLAWNDVEVVPKHHPAPFDVKRKGTPPALVCEVKQQIVTESEVLDLPRRAAIANADLAIYAALDLRQPPLPVDRLRSDSLDRHGVLMDVVQSTHELVAHACVSGGVSTSVVLADLPQLVAAAAPEADVSAEGVRRLAMLLRRV